jgi:hypothetical protein
MRPGSSTRWGGIAARLPTRLASEYRVLGSPAFRSARSMSAATGTLGVESPSRRHTAAVCAIRWSAGTATVELLCLGELDCGTPLDEKFLFTTIRGDGADFDGARIEKTAIDAPFGWPEPFIEALVAHRLGGGWEAGMDYWTDMFQQRQTDRFVKDICGKSPPSVRGLGRNGTEFGARGSRFGSRAAACVHGSDVFVFSCIGVASRPVEHGAGEWVAAVEVDVLEDQRVEPARITSGIGRPAVSRWVRALSR